MTRVLGSAWLAVTRRWKRNVLTVAAVALGSATIVAMISISQASALRVVDRLTEFESPVITVGLPSDAWQLSEADILARLAPLPDILIAGTIVLPESGGTGASVSFPINGTRAIGGVVVATTEGLATRGVQLISGSMPPPDDLIARDPYIAMLGTRIAQELGFNLEQGAGQLTINGLDVRVAGIVRDGADGNSLSTSVILSPGAARALDLLPQHRVVSLRVPSGSADRIAPYIPDAIYLRDPASVTLQYPPSPQQLRDDLLRDSNNLVGVIGWIMLGVTTFGIITTMQIAVAERRREIGIARALGVSRAGVAAGFFFEAMILGSLGATVGLVIGVVAGAVVAQLSTWMFVLPPIILLIPFVGLAVGSISGFWPALNASKTDPAELLRA